MSSRASTKLKGFRRGAAAFLAAAVRPDAFTRHLIWSGTRLFIGPVFTRELVTAPRRPRHFIMRAAYAGALFVLALTAWAVLTGTQEVRSVGDLAWFGTMVFQILAPFQLALALFFSALLTASAVAQEKDRQTLILLLMTDLSNRELVLGKLTASLLNVFVLLVAAAPIFFALLLLGGVDTAQIFRVFAVTLLTAIAAGSLGSTMALWREKTFQTLALTLLALVFWLGAWEAIGSLGDEAGWLGFSAVDWATAMSPWRAIIAAASPALGSEASLGPDWLGGALTPLPMFWSVAALIAVALNAIAIARVRAWNPSREVWRAPSVTGDDESIFSPEARRAMGANVVETDEEPAADSSQRDRAIRIFAGGRTRQVWDQPVLWREIRTWAYGRRVVVIRAAYLFLFALGALALIRAPEIDRAAASLVMIPLYLLSLVLINAQAVTSLSTERDAKTLDLLLVTDISPREFIFGKLAGVFYNTKEMLLLPIALSAYLAYRGAIGAENFIFLLLVLLVMNVFVAMLGIHSGLIHGNSRVAIGSSLGTVFFLFLGVATCMRIMVAFSDSFQYQLMPFAMVMLGGGVGLFLSLGARNASSAIFVASFICPFATFYAITSYLLGNYGFAFLAMTATYSFATAAMLVPAIGEFDVASGRTSDAGE